MLPAVFSQSFAFLGDAPLPCILLDRGGRIHLANDAAGTLLEKDPVRLKGESFASLFRPSGSLLSLLRSRSPRRLADGLEGSVLCPPSYLEVPVSIRIQRLRSDRRSFFLAWISDDRMVHELSRRLEHSEKLSAMAIVAGKVAHEIRTPLNAIFLNNDLLQERVLRMRGVQGEKLRRYIAILQEEVERLDEVVRSYLSLARLAGGDRQPTVIEEFLGEVIDQVRESYSLRNITFATAFRSRIGPLPLNRRQFRRVMLNLFSNSRDAMRNGGVITVSTGSTPEVIRLTVSDTGEGIPPVALSQLTTPFISHKANGSGLGLYLAREIVEHHGGRLDIQSLQGEGTSVIITLPLRS